VRQATEADEADEAPGKDWAGPTHAECHSYIEELGAIAPGVTPRSALLDAMISFLALTARAESAARIHADG